MNKNLSNGLKTILFFAVGAFFVYRAALTVDLAEVWEKMESANYWWVMLSMALGYVAIISRGARWNIVLRSGGHPVGLWKSTHAVGIGYMVNMGVPRLGELARATSLSQKSNAPMDQSLGTIVMERLIDILFLGLLIGLAFLTSFDELGEFMTMTSADTAGESTGGSGSTILWILMGAMAVCGGLIWLFRKPLMDTALGKRISMFMEGLWQGFRQIQNLDNPWGFWGHSVLIWACYFFMIYTPFMAMEFSSHLMPDEALFIMVAASLGVVFPAPAAGVGIYHLLVSNAFVILGYDRADGMSMATIVHSSQLLLLIGSGIIGLIGLSRVPNKV